MSRGLVSLVLTPLIVGTFAVLGGMYGNGVEAAIAIPEPQTGIGADAQTFSRFYATVQANFADPVSADKAIYDGAIPGMLATLDPHSGFYDPKAYKQFLEDQKGHYSGVGMEVGSRDNKTVVLAPFPGSPAYRVGIRPGDVLVSINDKSTQNMSTGDVADLLKGQRGTSAKIVVSRQGAPDYLSFTVTREEIDRKSVPDGFFIAPGIAYIKIISFDDNTGRQLESNLRRLGQDKFAGLVLDLRGNPGGLLTEAIDVSSAFLPRGATVVSARGRSEPEKTYASHGPKKDEAFRYPIVVLVNQYTASAAEIVSGALQDHDRGLIMGQTTFGKGLVQTVFNVADNTAVALTTMHFYTPSGRLIQRDYTNKSFYDYYFHHDGATNNLNDARATDAGRTVFGGGGITPDEKYTPPAMDHLEAQLYRTGLFGFTRSYFAGHPPKLPAGWMPDAAALDQLRRYLRDNGYQFSDGNFTADEEWIRRYLAKEMYVFAFNVDESDKVFAKTDPEVLQAAASMPKAQALMESAKKALARRR
jgi:carboxyl-terminal processing protease